MGPDEWASFEDGFSRHVHNLGFVPPEFAQKQTFANAANLPASTRGAWALSLTGSELQAIEEAGTLAHRKAITHAEAARERGGYGGLGPDVKVPDQRHLLTDSDPLD